MSLDLSKRPEFAPLAGIARDMQAAAREVGVELLLVGATARDLLALHAGGRLPGRASLDVDFAVAVSDWKMFEELRATLIAKGRFRSEAALPPHRLIHADGTLVDLVPFGGVEGPDRTYRWPDEPERVLNCFGVQEALKAAEEVILPGGVSVIVPSIPALAILKITAWQDRKFDRYGVDAGDFFYFLRRYLDFGNLDRAASDHPDLFDPDDFDYDLAGARLLGRDLAGLLDKVGRAEILNGLRQESSPGMPPLMAMHSGAELQRATDLIAALCRGIEETA